MESQNKEFCTKKASRNEKLKSWTMPWMDLWQTLAQYFAPRMAGITVKRGMADVIHADLYEDIGKESAEDFASGCVNYIIPPGETWARFESRNPDPSQAEIDFWQEATKIILEDMVSSSFHLCAHDDFLISGVFGTATVRVEKGDKNPYRFTNLYPGRYQLENNNDDEPDVHYQEIDWTAKQCADKFGREALHDNMLKDLDGHDSAGGDSGGFREWKILYLVEPRKGGRTGLMVPPHERPYCEYWIDVENNHQLGPEGGFYENPYITNRMYLCIDSFWGHSLAMRTLPKVQQLCQMEEDLMLAQELRNNPPWLAPDDGSFRSVNIPGGTTYYKADKDPRHRPSQVDLKNDTVHTEETLMRKRNEVARSWFSDMFQMFADAPKQRTATEVLAMIEQKLVLFTPFFTRYTKEKLTPILGRCLGIAWREGRLPQPPAEVLMSGGDFKVEYSSRIALAVKLFENRQLLQLLDMAGVVAQYDPSVIKVLKSRDIFRKLAQNMGVDPKLLESEQAIRAALNQEMSMQQAMQAAQLAETSASAMSKLPEGGEGLLKQAV